MHLHKEVTGTKTHNNTILVKKKNIMFKKFLFIFHFVYKQAGTNYVLREYRSKEKKQELLKVNIYFGSKLLWIEIITCWS